MLAIKNTTRLVKRSKITRLTLQWSFSVQEWVFQVAGDASPPLSNTDTIEVKMIDDATGLWITPTVLHQRWIDEAAAEAWVLNEFPSFVKVGNAFYHPDEHAVTNEGDVLSYHPLGGTLFINSQPETEDDKTIRYVELDGDIEKLKAVQRGINGDTEGNDTFYYALIRRRTPIGWKYYPLPLVYASESERILAAQAINSTPPPERWIRRRRTAIEKLLDTLPQ